MSKTVPKPCNADKTAPQPAISLRRPERVTSARDSQRASRSGSSIEGTGTESCPADQEPESLSRRGRLTMLLSAGDVAREFGVSTKTVRRLDLTGKIPRPVHIGRSVRWRWRELVAWLAAGAPPRDEWHWEPKG